MAEFRGTTGNDTLISSDHGGATLIGGAGNDLIEGGAGGDALDGGDGTDRVSYAGSNAAVSVNLAIGNRA